MKNIKYIILSLSLVIMTSCGDDDFSRAYVDDEVKTALAGTLSLDANFASPATPIGFSFTLPQTVEAEATIEVTAVSFDFVQTKTFVTIPAGQTTGTGSISMPNSAGDTGGVYGINEYASVSLTGLALTQPAEGVIADPYVLTSEAVSVTLYDRIQWPYGDGVVAGRMTALLDWTNPGGNDLDMYMGAVESAESGSRWETDIFNDTHADGTYTVQIGVWTAADTEIPWKIFFVHPDQTTFTTFEGTLTGLALGTGVNAGVNIATLTKSTDGDGVVSYTFAAL